MKQKTEVTSAVDYKKLRISSTMFRDNEPIPSRYTCDGENINPPLDIYQVPEETKSLAIIVDDPDAPAGTWVHWVMWNIPVTHHFKENEARGLQGLNDAGKHRYSGPCPPGGTHRYFFKIYALSCLLDLPANTTKKDLERAMSNNIIGFGELTGLYSRKK